jgi:hypothetical protein
MPKALPMSLSVASRKSDKSQNYSGGTDKHSDAIVFRVSSSKLHHVFAILRHAFDAYDTSNRDKRDII